MLGSHTNFLHNHANMGGGYVGGVIYYHADNFPQVPLISPQSTFQIDIKMMVTPDIVNNIHCLRYIYTRVN